MKNKLLTIGLGIISIAAILIPVAMPSVVFASTSAIKTNVFDPTMLAGPLVVCVGTADQTTQLLPVCQNLCDLVAQIAQIIYYAIAVVIWIITPILVTVGGIMIMLGGANPGMIETGKKTITGAVIGIVIVLCAYLIVATFVGFLGIKGIGGFGVPSCQISSAPATTTNTAVGS